MSVVQSGDLSISKVVGRGFFLSNNYERGKARLFALSSIHYLLH